MKVLIAFLVALFAAAMAVAYISTRMTSHIVSPFGGGITVTAGIAMLIFFIPSTIAIVWGRLSLDSAIPLYVSGAVLIILFLIMMYGPLIVANR